MKGRFVRRSRPRFGGVGRLSAAAAPLLAVAALTVAALVLAGCGEMDLLGLVRLRVTGVSGPVIYVSPDWGIGTGLSPSRPVRDPGVALERARSYDTAEIWIAAGDYEISQDHTPALPVYSSVVLRGGYSADFTEHDPATYRSRLISDGEVACIFNVAYEGGEMKDIESLSIEDLEFEINLHSAPQDTEHTLVVHLSGCRDASVVSSKFVIRISGDYSVGYAVMAIDGGTPSGEGENTVAHYQILDNDILIVSDNDVDVTGIRVGDLDPGSSALISGNRVAVSGPRAVGVKTEECDDLFVWNNVVSARSDSDARGIYSEDGFRAVGTVIVAHNTIVTSSPGTNVGLSLVPAAGSDPRVMMNILGTPSEGNGTGFVNYDAPVLYQYNLCFGYGAETGGDIADPVGNVHVLTDISSEVFSSPYDGDLSDGDDANYHLDDTSAGGPYAVDMGTATALEGAEVDFEGDSRPQGSAVDIGADEKVP